MAGGNAAQFGINRGHQLVGGGGVARTHTAQQLRDLAFQKPAPVEHYRMFAAGAMLHYFIH
jgi:hypothetical protein